MNKPSFLFCNINKLKFKKKRILAILCICNAIQEKEIENSRKHILLDILTIYQNKMFNKQIYTLIFHYM